MIVSPLQLNFSVLALAAFMVGGASAQEAPLKRAPAPPVTAPGRSEPKTKATSRAGAETQTPSNSQTACFVSGSSTWRPRNSHDSWSQAQQVGN